MKKRTTFYFLSGYLAFLCGLLLILIPLYYNTLSLFEQRQLTLTQQRLSGGLEQLEQQMESLHGIAFSIGRDAEYRMYARKDAYNPTPVDFYHLGKLHEEVSELDQAAAEQSNVEEELGDVLFSAVCVAAKAEIDPEMALHSACEKFIRRFAAMEQAAEAQGRSLDAYTPAEQLALWQAAKHK